MQIRAPSALPYSLAFLLALLLLVGLAVQGVRLQQALVDANALVSRSLERISAIQSVLSSMQDVETGERGFVITGSDAYLEPYAGALLRLDTEQQRLTDLYEPLTVTHRAWLAELRRIIAERLRISTGNIDRRRQDGLAAAAEQLPRAGGRPTMDRLRAHLDRLEQAERDHLAALSVALEHRLQSSRRQAVIGGMLVAALFFSALWAVHLNLTRRQRISARAQAGEARWRALLQAVPDQLFEVGPSGRVQHLTAHTLGDEMTQQALRRQLVEMAKGDVAGGFGWRDEGGNHYEIRLAPTGNGFFLAMVRDISERRRVEQMKSEFISTVSHELRTPLTAIRSALGMVTGGMVGEVSDEQRPLLAIAYKNSERLSLLINDILDMEKLESGRLEFHWSESLLTPLLQQSLEQIEPYAREFNVRLALAVDADGLVRIDTDRFAQVMANLLSNAIKFSPPGGTVEIGLARRGGSLEIAVKDHGPGIPQAFRAKVFERFAQADSSDRRRRGGTGLGLAITRALVDHLGGDIGFDSVENRGTCFHVRLPLLPQAAEPAASGHPDVLLVEDDVDLRQVVASLFADAPLRLHTAGSLLEARRQLARRSHALVILDLALPDGSGSELLDDLAQTDPPTPAIIFSAYDSADITGPTVVAKLTKSRHDDATLARLVREQLNRAAVPRSIP